MHEEDMAEKVRKILAKLPKEEREILEADREMLLDAARRGASTIIMARNFSHGVGRIVKPKQ
jgi:hypothetical protein